MAWGGGNLYSSDSRELEKIAFILKSFSYFGKIRNSPRYNVTRKRCTKFHVAMMIKNYFSAGATVTAQIFLSPKMCKIAFFSKSFRNFQKIQNTPLGNAARKVCTKFHDATMIRKDLKIGGTADTPEYDHHSDDADAADDGLKGHFGIFQSPIKKILGRISTCGFLHRIQ